MELWALVQHKGVQGTSPEQVELTNPLKTRILIFHILCILIMFNNSLLISNRYPLRLYNNLEMREIHIIKISVHLRFFCLLLKFVCTNFQGQRTRSKKDSPGEKNACWKRGVRVTYDRTPPLSQIEGDVSSSKWDYHMCFHLRTAENIVQNSRS